MKTGPKTKLGLVGAGAIARHTYLPALRNSRSMDLVAVIDTDSRSLAGLKDDFALSYAGSDLDAALKHVDAVLICVPNYLHHEIAGRCLGNGKHVLCEKPVCIHSGDAEDLLKSARDRSLVFTAAHVRRFYPAAREIRRIIADREFGTLREFDFREGTVFSWPSITGFGMDGQKAGGGVLMDIGVHLLDLLFWWIDDEVSSFQYADDCLGGLEATAEIRLAFRKGPSGFVKLTRLSVLKNFYTLFFEKAVVSWNPFMPQRIYIRKPEGKIVSRKMPGESPIENMLLDFAGAVEGKRAPAVKPEEAVTGLRFIESCYAGRQTIAMPWLKAKGSQ